jgi:CxxC motif-containing protein
MMKNLTCIVCPIGCSLTIEEKSGAAGSTFMVTGNRCPRGAAYAQEEIRAPKRVVTATCAVRPPCALSNAAAALNRSLTAPRRLPVKTVTPCPKEKINFLLADIYKTKVTLPVKAGDKIIADWQGSGIDVVAVRSLE